MPNRGRKCSKTKKTDVQAALISLWERFHKQEDKSVRTEVSVQRKPFGKPPRAAQTIVFTLSYSGQQSKVLVPAAENSQAHQMPPFRLAMAV
jgi:hypothetical protein